MAERRRLTLADMEAVGGAATGASVEAARNRRRVKLQDIEPKAETKEVPFEGGSTLQVRAPLPGDWETYDTGIPLSQGQAQFLAGAGKRFSDIGRRVAQIRGEPGAQEEIDVAAQLDRPLMETTPGMIGHMAPDMLALAPVSGPARILGRPLNLSSYKTAGALGALQGASQPVTSDAGEDAAMLNAGMGALGGVIGAGVGRGITGIAGKLGNLAPGMIPESVRAVAKRRGVDLPEVRWRNDEARRLYELGQEYNVPTTIGDLDPSSGFRKLESMMEHMPSGRRSFLENQQEAMRGAVNRLRSEIGPGAKGREGAEIQTGLREQYDKVRKVASDKFKVVDDIVKADPNIPPIKPVETYNTVREVIDEYPSLFNEFKDSKTIRRFLGLERDVGPQPGLIINPKTSQPFKYDQELSFDEAQYLRKRLGAWQDKIRKQSQSENPTVDREAAAQAARVFGAFERDLDNWATTQPNSQALASAWKDARSYFAENVLPYRYPSRTESKTRLIADIINDKVDPETIPTKALPGRETSIASDIMELSSPRGQQAMKSALIGKMTEQATEVPQGLDTAALLRHTNRFGHSGESVFDPSELGRIADVRDLASATSRSGDLSRLEGGDRLTSMLLGGSALAGAPYVVDRMTRGIEGMTPGEKAFFAIAALPTLGLLGGKGGQMFASGPRMQNLYFADPIMEGALGGLQRYVSSAIRGAGEPTLEEWRSGALGHRP